MKCKSLLLSEINFAKSKEIYVKDRVYECDDLQECGVSSDQD